MEFSVLIGITTLLIAVYFPLGLLLKFVWGWLPLCIGLSVATCLALLGDWIGAFIALFIALISITGAAYWQNTGVFITIEQSITKKFSLND